MLPLPPDFAGVLADVEPDVEAGLDAGGDDFFTLAVLLDGHGVLDGVAALDLAGWLTGGALELVPGSGGWVPLVGGDEESVGGAVMVGGGDELAGGGLVGLELVEPGPVGDLIGGGRRVAIGARGHGGPGGVVAAAPRRAVAIGGQRAGAAGPAAAAVVGGA